MKSPELFYDYCLNRSTTALRQLKDTLSEDSLGAGIPLLPRGMGEWDISFNCHWVANKDNEQLGGRWTTAWACHTGHLLQPKTLLGKDNANMDINLEQRLVQVNSRAPAGTSTATGTGSGSGSG